MKLETLEIRIQRINRKNMMDSCFVDIMIEFLSVSFHNILYYAQVYPRNIFETRKKYSVVVHRSIHPEVNQYIDLCLKSIAEYLKSGHLSRIEFSITDSNHTPVIKFVFDIHKNDQFDDTTDAYLVQTEQELRAFCLNLSSISNKFKDLPDDRSFTIHLHTNESTAVALATDPDLEDFPLIEVEDGTDVTDSILPLRRFSVRNYTLDTYVEMK